MTPWPSSKTSFFSLALLYLGSHLESDTTTVPTRDGEFRKGFSEIGESDNEGGHENFASKNLLSLKLTHHFLFVFNFDRFVFKETVIAAVLMQI